MHFLILPLHSGRRAARSASASLISMRTKTPPAANGTHSFVFSMFAYCTAMAPLARIFDNAMLAVQPTIANLTVPLDFCVNAIKASLAWFVGQLDVTDPGVFFGLAPQPQAANARFVAALI